MTRFLLEIPAPESSCYMSAARFSRLCYLHARSHARLQRLIGEGAELPKCWPVTATLCGQMVRICVELPGPDEIRLERLLESSGVCFVR